MTNYLLPYRVIIIALFFVGCSNSNPDKKHTFGEYTLQGIIDLQEKIWTVSYKRGDEAAVSFIDSLSLLTEETASDFNYFIIIHKTYLNAILNSSHKYEGIENFHNLINQTDFIAQHPLNKAYTHYFYSKILRETDNLKEAINQLELGVQSIENGAKLYDAVLCMLYNSLGVVSVSYAGETIESAITLNKALKLALKVGDYSTVFGIYSELGRLERINKNYLSALAYYQKTEAAFKKSTVYSKNELWSEFYVRKVSLFFMLDDKNQETNVYKDSIKYYLDRVEQEYETNEISVEAFTDFIRYNINSIIKIKEYEKARKLIAKLEAVYLKDVNTNCYNLALINMNKYALERAIGTAESYRIALIYAFNHMESCGEVKEISYGVLLSNVLYYLTNIDSKNGDFKNAFKWSQLKNASKVTNNLNLEYENKVQQLEFWKNREMRSIEHILKLNQEKGAQINDKLTAAVKSLLILMTFLMGILYLFFKVRKQKTQINQNKILLEQKNKSLKVLNNDLTKSTAEILEHRKKLEAELKSKLLFIMQRNDMLKILEAKIKDTDLEYQEKSKLYHLINSNNQASFWKEIEEHFLDLNRAFVQLLFEKSPNLTASNIKLCLLIKLGLSNKEIASLRYLSAGSVKVAKNRLYKKLGINVSNITIYSYLNSLDKLP